MYLTDMLSPSVGSMIQKPSTFSALPSSTNAVESLHKGAKGKHANVLKVALMSTYKVDMASALEYTAATKNIPICYEKLTPSVRKQRAIVAEKARVKRMRKDDDMWMNHRISADTSVCLATCDIIKYINSGSYSNGTA